MFIIVISFIFLIKLVIFFSFFIKFIFFFFNITLFDLIIEAF